MKGSLLICIVVYLMSSCSENASIEKGFLKQFEKTTTEKLNDSTTEYSFWINKSEAICYIVFRQDTIERYRYLETSGYAHYSYFNKNGAIEEMQQMVFLDDETFPNESINFDTNGTIIDSESSYLKATTDKDSVRISLNSGFGYFNKIRVIISDNEKFNINSWKIIDTVETFNPCISLHKNYESKKCKLQVIKTDKNGKDESGRDFYFDLKNLMCRDVKKSLLCVD